MNVALRQPVLDLTVLSATRIAVGTPVVATEEQDRPSLVVRPAHQNEPAIGVVNSAPAALDLPVHGWLVHGISVGGLAPGRAGAAFGAGVFLGVGRDGRLVDVATIDASIRNVVAQAIVGADGPDRVVAVRVMASQVTR